MRRVAGLAFAAAVMVSSSGASAKDETPKSNEAQTDASKPICKSQLEVGSLVKRKKRCFTQAQWDRVSESAQQGGRRMQDSSTGLTPAGF